ncbi:MAG: class I SAM-dependent methyltransferase [Xanthomonadaceae bacterium]|nr:class I SAM-dependent methyltransferase [Xanthomonadaceae bacterium]
MTTATLDANELSRDRAAPGLLGLAERGLLPDAAIRAGIRRLCAQRLEDERAGGVELQSLRQQELLELLRQSPVAIETEAANAQHYELPPAFFFHCLGPRLKYSSCYYPRGDETLAEAEEAMLALYCERAGLADGQDILELGCGWGSLTLWMAEHYPNARITAVSNSNGQRGFIEARCRERGLENVRVLTRDANTLELPTDAFDRCVSVEMFEHMRNYDSLLGRIGSWLRPGGQLFVHIFVHRTLLYPFETQGDDNWMGRHFFTGGLMPAADTLLHFQGPLAIRQQWLVEGTHYEKTANHWLQQQDAHRDKVMAILREAYGDAAGLWFQRWRMFWMACAELFGYADGQEWMVSHYLFERP